MKNFLLTLFLIFITCYVHSQEEPFSNSHSSQSNRNGIPGEGVTDIDDNFYPTVIIGNQEWMAENLRVSKYRNGDAIPTGLTDSEWQNTTSGAYAIYDHNAWNTDGINSAGAMVAAYGALYNWYAVDDARGLCPEGWSVSGDSDWSQLVNYVVSQGFPNSTVTNGAGNALKSCRQVNSPLEGECNTSTHPRWGSHDTHSGFDEFGFSALPGGSRWSLGSFNNVGFNGDWWSASEFTGSRGWYRYMRSSRGDVFRSHSDKRSGLSVRCVRDISEEPTLYNLNLEAHPEGAGIVSGQGEYEEGELVNITATANEGWEFINWTGDTEHVHNANSSSTTVTLPASDISLTANFAGNGVQENLVLSDESIADSETECFDALQTITVSDFTIESGGNATLIAGESIHLLPGTTVEHGGYLLARIAAHEDDFCGIPRATEIAKEPVTSKDDDVVSADFIYEIRENGFFKLYPNPTDGTFTLELTTAKLEQNITVEVHSMLGGRLFTKELPPQRMHTLSLESQQPGIYIIRVMKGDKVSVERLIKQ